MALYIAFRVLDIRGKNIVVPAFTWRSTAEAAIMAGGTPIFADIEEKTLTLYLDVLGFGFKSDIICVNDCFGCPSDYQKLEESGYSIIYDSASAFGATYWKKPIGMLGIHCFSLSPTKVLTANEGGLVTCNDENFADELKDLRRWAGRMTEFNASCALEGLKYLPETLIKKRKIVEKYHEFAINQGWQVQEVPEDRESTYKDCIVILPDMQERDSLRDYLEAAGVETRIYFTPTNEYLRGVDYYAGNLSITEDIHSRGLCLPCWSGVDQEFILKIMGSWINGKASRDHKIKNKRLERVWNA